MHQLVGIFAHRLDLNHELGVGLIGVVLPQPFRLNHHAHVIALRKRIDGLNRRGEITYVEATAQVFRQRRFLKLHHQYLALLPNINTGIGLTKFDNHPAGTIRRAAEVNITQGRTR